MKVTKISKLTIEEYFQQEQETGFRYEFNDGKIYALAGGTINHGILCGKAPN